MTITEARAPAPAMAARPVDARALERARQRLQSAPAAPWLHGEIARRMAARLPIVKLQPAAVLDWSGPAGASAALLQQTYPRARHGLVAPAPAALPAAPWWSPRRWQVPPMTMVAEADIAVGAAQLLWSNMALHLESQPQALLARWHRALAVDGFLMFSTLGPGSLGPLRTLYASKSWGRPAAPFVDMHDLGDMLIEAGFADPVMDQETLTLTWPTARALVDELHGLGANADPARFAGLRTPRWRLGLHAALQASADASGRIALDFEIVYGHAFRPLPKPRVTGRTEVPVDDLRQMARAGRRRA